MKRVVGLMALLIAVLTVTPATADFYVIAGGGRLGTAITALPYTITSPGLYYLTNNLTSSGTNNCAISVDADDVTIDLMGFCLTGPGKTSGPGNSGIVVEAARTSVEIRNGAITAFGNDGIRSAANTCSGIRMVGLRVREIGSTGVNLLGYDHLVMDCTVRNTSSSGIIAAFSTLVKGSQVAGMNFYGISLGVGSVAVGNTVRGVAGTGIYVSAGSSVTDNAVFGNSNNGIYATGNCTITRNTACSNGMAGIYTGVYCTITNNTTDGLTNGASCWLADNVVTP